MQTVCRCRHDNEFQVFDAMYKALCVKKSGGHDSVCGNMNLIMWSFMEFLGLGSCEKLHDHICKILQMKASVSQI